MGAPAGIPPRSPREGQPRWGNTNEERLLDAALAAATIPGATLALQPPPLPQIDPWRPRTGYPDRALGVRDVLALNRLYPDRRDAWSGGPHDWQGSARMTEFWF